MPCAIVALSVILPHGRVPFVVIINVKTEFERVMIFKNLTSGWTSRDEFC